MIEIKASEYKVISQELIESDIEMYKKSLENWRNSENIPKPYPNYWFTETIVENNIEWKFIDDNQEAQETNKQKHNELIDINHKNYNHSYARSNADDGYASLEDQKDMQYWDLVNGTKKWQDHIKSVKDRYPKRD